MTAVFAVRHPLTTWNVAERYQGRLESPLTPEGHAQARILAQLFSGQGLAAVWSSPLRRSFELAVEIARASDVPLCVDQRLTEIALGPWEGLYRAEIEAKYPELYTQWYARPDEVTFPGGESLLDVQTRSQAALRDILTRHPQDNIALVSHSAVIQVLASAALGLPLKEVHRLRVSNSGITTLCGLEAPGSVLSFNLTSHLHHSPVTAASAQNCVSWKERRATV